MSTLVPLTINVTSEQLKRLGYLARHYRYATVEEYVLAVLEEVVEEPTKEEILEDLRVSFRQALNGETIPASELHRLLSEDDDK
jgi:hypothetical protein